MPTAVRRCAAKLGTCVVCNLRISRLFADLPIAVMATGTRSNVTPVVLREDTRPPAYGTSTLRVRLGPFTQGTCSTRSVLHTLLQEALYSARWYPLRSLFLVTCRKFLLACTINPAQLLLRSLKLRLRAMLGMVRALKWNYLQRPRPWREFHHCFGAGGAVSSSAGRARVARNRQVPRRSGSAIGVAS